MMAEGNDTNQVIHELQENFTQRYFRDSLACFATGVTVITSFDAQQRPVGLTASSFSSVSLDPPLILWSLENKAASMAVFSSNEYFGVSVLTSQQLQIAHQFATRGIDRFKDVPLFYGESGVPLLSESLAWFECKRYASHLAGDHTILVGQVLRVGHKKPDTLPDTTTPLNPLLYCFGKLSCGLKG